MEKDGRGKELELDVPALYSGIGATERASHTACLQDWQEENKWNPQRGRRVPPRRFLRMANMKQRKNRQ